MNIAIISNKFVILIITFTLVSFSLSAAHIDDLERRVNYKLKGFKELVDGKKAYKVDPKRHLEKLKGALRTIDTYDKIIDKKNKKRSDKLKKEVKEAIKIVTEYIDKVSQEKQKTKQDSLNKRKTKKALSKIEGFENRFENILKSGISYKYDSPKGYYGNLEGLLEEINILKRMMEIMEENEERYNKIKNRVINEMKTIEKYMKSEAYKKIEQKRNQKIIDSWRLGKNRMKSKRYYKIIKKELPKGKILRVVIDTPIWNVKREYKEILYKYLDVSLALKYKKRCYFITGIIKSTYLGGGKYGKKYFKIFRGADYDIEMNCKNVYK